MTEKGTNLLKAKIKEFGETQEILADSIGLSFSRLNAKINGTGGAEFTSGEIAAIKLRYDLTMEDVGRIFFG